MVPSGGSANPQDGDTLATANDPIGTALAALASGAATGAAVMTGGVLAVRMGQRGSLGFDEAAGATILTASLFLGIVAAAGSGWVHTRTLPDPWRRGVTAAVAVLGAALLSIAAIPADRGGGILALGPYWLVLAGAAVGLHVRARRASRR